MDSLFLQGAFKTPEVNFNGTTGVLSLQGKSIPEDSEEFYKPLYNWAEKYCQSPCRETIINIKLEYFNTSTERALLKFLRKFVTSYNDGNPIKINWYYSEEDEEMFEIIDAYKKLVGIPIEAISVRTES